jgi:hypothetical protein
MQQQQQWRRSGKRKERGQNRMKLISSPQKVGASGELVGPSVNYILN